MQEHHSWAELDRVYTFCRRQLATMADWRYGPRRIEEVAKEGLVGISPHINILGKDYCDLGCGTFHPFGISAVFYINGANSCVALDYEPSDMVRAAEALADLITDSICFPDKWHWSSISREEFMARTMMFDLDSLRSGDIESGIGKVPIRHIVTDIHHPILEPRSIDIMSSRATLEHFLDFKLAISRLYDLMRDGGVAYHSIDLVDHRAYLDEKLHYWSFLSEPPEWSDGVCNRLRSSQIKECLETQGFQVLLYEKTEGEMPEGFRLQLAYPYNEMSLEDLNTTGVRCIIKKT